MLSKTLAKEAAWKFAKENGIDMITMGLTSKMVLKILRTGFHHGKETTS
jgi:hypothetical protein